MLVKIMIVSRHVQVSCSLLELCRRHVVMLQVKILQVAKVHPLFDNVLERTTVWIFAHIRDI